MKVSLVVPLFNEQHALGLFYQAVLDDPQLQRWLIEIVFIDDGSRDATNRIARSLVEADPNVVLLTFSRNFGKEAALFAGLEHATGDAVIPVDVDLQDPVSVIAQLIEAWRGGAEIVLAKRRHRSEDSFFKRHSAALFYKVLRRISTTRIEENVGDFRLLDRKVVEVIKGMPEQQMFMKGILSWAGFDTVTVEYDRAPRAAGISKFSVWKLWNLALDGVTSFSTVPLRVWSYIGGAISFCALMYAVCLMLRYAINGNPVPGYSSLMVSILFLGGIQLIGIGIMGEYIGRIYLESKHRPRYVVKQIIRHGGPGE
ncbi:glycosyltransferase family 2 protein [Pseudomonas sp. LP_7_YM]|uniref:glycosyltransferase family 2 protein n=1 Tax=Pseudomonas sp. LP_7_YM TaxID=2485137 RepID=UPI00105BBCD6|nr:glycosyltransferase family 2 protein [Pseudomonas sp. LP_7_YM]TDV70126.1 glycosyltransferase involved in cell wall biosynthesis [Pseudomonas sp. LP_7_YM]